jgi:DegV family protein with EDD domain
MIHFGEDSYTEGINIDIERFLYLLKSSSQLPKTSAPPPDMFKALFLQYENTEESILCIHPSAELSGTVRSAEIAKLDFPQLDIRVIDSELIASPLGIIVHRAAIWASQGLSADRITVEVMKLAKRSRIYFLVATLDYLAKGGRIGGASALLGNALKVKPILTLADGLVEQHSKERTFSKALTQIKSLVLSQYPDKEDGHLTIMHADNYELAIELADEFTQDLSIQTPLISNLPPAIITHVGPGSIAVGFFE